MARLRTFPRRPARIRFLGILLLAVVFALPAFAQAPPSGDTFVSSAFPSTNFGYVNSLAVGPGSTSYVQFNLAGIPAGASVSKATLRLYVDWVTKPGKFDVYQLSKSWNENTLTYNTPPPSLGPSLTGGTGISITAASCNQFLLIDITALAQGWLNGTIPNNGVALALTTGSSGNFFFDAKESLLTANGPQLVIALSGTGPQGPQGPAGPTGPQGAVGPGGPKGDTGATGSAGTKGDRGAAGAQGLAGPQGAQGAQGQTGPMGPMGLIGPQGSQGDAGLQGPAGADGRSFTFRNAFDNSASYAVHDVVSYNGASYVATAASQGPNNPSPDGNPTAWSLMAQAGAAGVQGPTGQQGMQGAPGPQGPKGDPGQKGDIGSQGAQGIGINWRGSWDCAGTYAVGDAVSYQGSSWIAANYPTGGCVQPPNAPWQLLAQQGPQGPQGPSGAVAPLCVNPPNRWVAGGDGTVTDCQTGLMWEQTTGTKNGINTGLVNDVNNSYSWSSTGINPDGTLYSSFLAALNNDVSSDGNSICFANHCDWRIPTIRELKGILLAPYPCSPDPCIDPSFGPTQSGFHWSATSRDDQVSTWFVALGDGYVESNTKTFNLYARAVRGGL